MACAFVTVKVLLHHCAGLVGVFDQIAGFESISATLGTDTLHFLDSLLMMYITLHTCGDSIA